MRTADWTQAVSVLDRVTAVFDAFGEHDEGLGVSELARRANLPKSTVSRISADLVAQRFLDRDGDRLFLGVRLFELAMTVEQPRRLRQHAVPVLHELRDVTGQAVNLAVLEGSDVVIVVAMRGEPGSTALPHVGGRLPAHATALGKAILAFSAESVVEAIVDSGLEQRTPNTRCEPMAFHRELLEIRRLGVAVECEECTTGRLSVASSIVGPGGAPVAAISVTGTASELVPERVAPAVRAAAANLSRRIAASREH